MRRLVIFVCIILAVEVFLLFIWPAPFFATHHTDDNGGGVVSATSSTGNTPENPTTPPTDKTPTEPEVPLPPINLVEQAVTLSDHAQTSFLIAKPFEVSLAADGLGKARFPAISPDGRVFVPDMVDYRLSHQGSVIILDDFNPDTGRFETRHTYLSGLRGPNSVAFYTDENGRHWLYLALTARLLRYPYEPGDTEPSGEPETIAEFPNKQVEGEESVVWHITRTIKFHDDRLYVSVGSGCNACQQPEDEMRAMIYSMKPDGTDTHVYARGLRNAVGFSWAGDTMYATENGVDHLGANAPDDVMYQLAEGEHYGWPYCYDRGGRVLADTSTSWKQPLTCEEVPLSFAAFEPHSAPLGIEYFANGHPVIRQSFLVALHGSHAPGLQHGYTIMRVSLDGEQDVFMSGFQKEDGTRVARPVSFLRYDDTSFFFTDDLGGRIFFVRTQHP